MYWELFKKSSASSKLLQEIHPVQGDGDAV